MLNIFFNSWIIRSITVVIIINIIIRLYKFYTLSYLFSVSVERFININAQNLVSYFTFKNVFASSSIKWRSKECYIKMLKAVLYIIYNETYSLNQYKNKKLSVIIFEVNPINNLYVAISDPLVFNYDDQLSAIEIFNKIKWNNIAFNNKLNDINIIIKLI